MLLTLFIVPLLTCSFISIIYSYTKFTGFRYLSLLPKLISLISFYINLLYGLYLWKNFPYYISSLDSLIYPASLAIGDTVAFEINSINLPFIILTTFVLIIALLTGWYTDIDSVLYSILLLLIEIFLIGAFSCTNLFIFLLFFEASTLPIFILIAFCGSIRRERLKATYYFLFFTLYGSLSLLLLLLNVYGALQIDYIVNNENTYFVT